MLIALFLQLLYASTPGGTVSLQMPEGWVQLDPPQVHDLKPQLKPENRMLQHLNDEPRPNVPLIAMKHDYPDDTMSGSVQLFVSAVPKEFRGASSIEAARIIAALAFRAFHGKYEIEPREVKLAAGTAGEWVMRYEMVEKSGATHDMRARNVVIVRGDRMYSLGYSGPAADTPDFEAFDGVVSSLKFGR